MSTLLFVIITLMAFITFYNRKPLVIPYHKAVLIQQIKQGIASGTPTQQAFAKQVKKIYLGKQHETDSLPVAEKWWQK